MPCPTTFLVVKTYIWRFSWKTTEYFSLLKYFIPILFNFTSWTMSEWLRRFIAYVVGFVGNDDAGRSTMVWCLLKALILIVYSVNTEDYLTWYILTGLWWRIGKIFCIIGRSVAFYFFPLLFFIYLFIYLFIIELDLSLARGGDDDGWNYVVSSMGYHLRCWCWCWCWYWCWRYSSSSSSSFSSYKWESKTGTMLLNCSFRHVSR